MRKINKCISFLILFLMLVNSGCGHVDSNSGDVISSSISSDNDKDERYCDYLRECIEEVIVQSTGCSSVLVDIDIENGSLTDVKIDPKDYAFTDTEKENIIQYIYNLFGNQNVEVIFLGASVWSSNNNPLKNVWYETRYYPIYLGSPEWGKHDMEEMFEVNNPPLDLLLSMPSEELAALLFESPYLNQMLTYYGEDGHIDYSMMFGFLELHSDIFYELLRREDGIAAILVQYQNSGIDSQWFADENYNLSDEEWNKFLSEVFGSQFLHFYSDVFTKEETDMAMQIISEKNSVYLESENANSEYFDFSDIEYHTGNNAGEIRVMYLTQEEISDREEKFIIP